MKKTDKTPVELINPNQIEHAKYHPKLRNRFMVTFETPYNIIKSWTVKGISRPKFIFNNDKIEYGDIHIRLSDTINPSTTYELINVIRNQEDRRKEIEFDIEMIGPINDIVEKWRIHGDIKTIDFGEMTWDDSGKQIEIELTIQVNDATLIY